MMDDFGLYPREEPFDPLGVMLFKALQVIAFLFFLALLAVSPDAKDGKIDSKAEFMITLDWPDNHPDDLDLFVQDPAGNIAWYRHREAGFPCRALVQQADARQVRQEEAQPVG